MPTTTAGTITRAEAMGAAANLRAVLAHIEDQDSELTASPAMRRRIEGAITGLDVFGGAGLPNPRAETER